jgi:hypothetical protein
LRDRTSGAAVHPDLAAQLAEALGGSGNRLGIGESGGDAPLAVAFVRICHHSDLRVLLFLYLIVTLSY